MFSIPLEEHLSYETAKDINWDAKLHKHYGSRKCDIIFIMYLISIIIWTLIIFFLKPQVRFLGWIILSAPFIFFFISIFTLGSISRFVEEENYDSNFTSSVIIIAIPLIEFLIKDTAEKDAKELTMILLLGAVIMMFSMIDVWVSEKWLSLTAHIRSVLQTISITLIIFTLYCYYERRYSPIK